MSDVAFLLPGWGSPPERLQPLADGLMSRGVEARVWRYAPAGRLPALTDALKAAVRAQRGRRVHLVGHSLGGIVCAATALEETPGTIASVTTVNAPWRGTWMGYTGSMELARQLRWGSDDLRQLRCDLARHLRAPDGPTWHVVAMYGDLGTPPSTSAATPRGARLERTLLPLWGHSVSLQNRRLVAAVCDRLVAPTAVRGA